MTDKNAKVMVQFHYRGNTAPDLQAVAQRFGVAVSDIDNDFGVIVTDPDAHLATILVTRDVADIIEPHLNVAGQDASAGEGVFGDVRIAPFGIPED